MSARIMRQARAQQEELDAEELQQQQNQAAAPALVSDAHRGGEGDHNSTVCVRLEPYNLGHLPSCFAVDMRSLLIPKW